MPPKLLLLYQLVVAGRWNPGDHQYWPILLKVAVHTMSEEEIGALLDCGIYPNTLDGRGRTRLVCATVGQFSGVVRILEMLLGTLEFLLFHESTEVMKDVSLMHVICRFYLGICRLSPRHLQALPRHL